MRNVSTSSSPAPLLFAFALWLLLCEGPERAAASADQRVARASLEGRSAEVRAVHHLFYRDLPEGS